MRPNSRQRSSRRVRLISGATAFFVITLTAIAYAASFDQILSLFEAGRYEEARTALSQVDQETRPGEELFWRTRLATDPEQALAVLSSRLGDPRLPRSLRLSLTLDAATIEFGRRNFRDVLVHLEPLLQDTQQTPPGQAYLLAGLALRATNNPQRAREMLASVRPEDPAFSLARQHLGEISLELNDPALALRYFESASRGTENAHAVRTAAGRWRALQDAGRQDEADALLAEIRSQHEQSLAMLEINSFLNRERDDLAARTATAQAAAEQTIEDQTVTVDAVEGRYAIQLGAFSDRGLALAFLQRYRGQVDDLHVDEVVDERGQFLYKVRAGAFVNPALARSEADRLGHRLDIDVYVVDVTD